MDCEIDALASLPLVQRFLQAFQRGIGIAVHFKGTNLPKAMLSSEGVSDATERCKPEYIAIPVFLAQKRVGSLVAGPVFRDNVKRLPRLSSSATGYAEASAVPILADEQYLAIRQLLEVFVDQLALIHKWPPVRSVSAEPFSVIMARNYIRAHSRDPVPLVDVAKHVHLCLDHLARLFKRATGFTLRQYLTRVRLEHVQELLTDPRQRICEAAFAAGFMSLASFNRAFREATGRNPKAWRTQSVLLAQRRLANVGI